MMRFPLFATLIVVAAVATMIGLGIWQLGRAGEKDALKARLEQNAQLPLMALPPGVIADETILFRRASAFCLEVTGWRRTGGKSAAGMSGTRFIADCRTGAEGPGFAADMGVSADPKAEPRWRGGEVTGIITAEPSAEGLVARLLGKAPPPRPMLVAAQPAPGFAASAPPTAESFTNNSLFYAVQWFFFAAAAAVIYLLALRRRERGKLPPGP